MGVITRYLLDFSAQDGKTAESLYLEAGGELVVTLDAGEWEIRAYGLLERGSGPPLAVICGTAQATVYAGRTENVLVVPDGSAALGGEPGFLSWKVKYPEEKIWGAVLTASVKTGENSFIPYTYFDLTDPNAREKTVSLPPGTYRIQSRFMAHNVNNDGPVEIVHIFSGMETASTPVTITGNAFPEAREFSSSDELKAYLDELDDNTADDPYLVKFNGADLSSRGKNGETLETLYKALSRYVTLDLRGCTGTELIAASTKDIPNQANIVSLILPGTVTKIEAKGFAEYKVLKSAILPKVTDIDYAAFNNLDKLETVSAPELTGLVDSKDSSTPSNGVFSNCSALKTVYFPKLKTVAHHAFYVCTALTEVLLPKAASVGNAVFRGCTALKTAVLLEASLIGDYAFFSDKSLENLVLGPVPPEVDSSGHFPEGCPQKLWVPASAVEDYRNSAFWVKKMKDRIYPLTD
jgi:hypothetical protein